MLIIKDLEQIVQVCDNGELYKCGQTQDQLAIIERRDDGVGCCLVIGSRGIIEAIGFDDQIMVKYTDHELHGETVIDGKGMSLIPGLIDPHTHPVWSGNRVFEFDLKMKGASYASIHDKGGGIYYTVEKTRKSPLEELTGLFRARLDMMMSCGTTLVECKTGYGLDYETELKMLKVIQSVRGNGDGGHPLEVMSTFLGAHAVPREMTAADGTDYMIEVMSKLKAEEPDIIVDFIDVFCEKGVYDVEQSRRILLAGRELFGADINFHGEELNLLGSAEMGAEIGAKSISHLEYVSEKGMEAMAKAKTVAIICPTTAYLLRLTPPPVRKMIAKGVIVAVGSDFNPNAYCYSMPMAMNVAVVKCGLTLNEALTSATINAAYALNRAESQGSLEVGKKGDLVLIGSNDWRHIIYQMGDSKTLIKAVVKEGTIVVKNF